MDDTADVRIASGFEIAKADVPAQIIFGWASVVTKADGKTPVVDLQGDVIFPEDLEAAAYDFVTNERASGDMHDGEPANGTVVESMVFTLDKQAALGIPEGTMPVGWWIGVHIPDRDIFEKVRSGERSMFSIEGQGIREPIEVEA